MTPAERMRLEQLVQGTDEWHAGRRGCITASLAGRLLTCSFQSLPSLVETIRADDGPGYSLGNVPAIERGNRLEDQARAGYEMRTGNLVRQVGLLVHPALDLVRCSPDGLVDPDGGVEIKCPTKREGHLAALAGTVPAVHKPQVQFSLWTSARAWWDYVSFRPDEPTRFRLAIVRVFPCAGTFDKFEQRARLLFPYLDGGLTNGI